jgi:hypothetical protein
MIEDTLQVSGKKIPVKVGDLDQFKLNFYPDNPRIFSIVHADTDSPDQEEIEYKLLKLDHVKHLIKSIKNHGGLIDPVIVHGGNFNVIEGNSRLAAYRQLAKNDPIGWAKIRVKLLPPDIEDKYIFALLGEYHIVGKKDWQPYEVAGYLYRQKNVSNISEEELAAKICLKRTEVAHSIKVYQFMLEQHAIPSRWSYYDEYLKSTKIKKFRKEYPELDKIVVKKIKSGEISRAVDIRDGLKKIAEAGGKTAKNFSEGKVNFKTSVNRAISGGKTDASYKKLNVFREWLHRNETKKELFELDKDDSLRKKCAYEARKISNRIEMFAKKL